MFSTVRIISHIGNGEFGSVAKAYWKKKSGVVEVAVKSVPLSAEKHDESEERRKLLQEAVMMGQFRHPNVVQLHGIATAGTSVSLPQHRRTRDVLFALFFGPPYVAMTT